MTNGGSGTDLTDVNSGNIIKPTVNDLSEDQRLQEYENDQRRRRQEFEDAMLCCYQKTRQGFILKESGLPSVAEAHQVGVVRTILPILKEEMSFLIDQSVSASVSNTHDNLIKSLDDRVLGHVKGVLDKNKMPVRTSTQHSVPHTSHDGKVAAELYRGLMGFNGKPRWSFSLNRLYQDQNTLEADLDGSFEEGEVHYRKPRVRHVHQGLPCAIHQAHGEEPI